MWFLRSNKTCFFERFSFLIRYELLLLEYFLFYFSVFIILHDYQLKFSVLLLLLLLLWLFSLLLLLLLLLLLTLLLSLFFLHFQCFYYHYYNLFLIILFHLCKYRIFPNSERMRWPNIVQSWQQRHWDCISVFDGSFEECIFILFFWRTFFEVTLIYFAIDNHFFYSLSIF